MDTPDSPSAGAINPNANPDPLLAALGSMLDGSPAVDPFALLKTQLEGQANPRAAMLLRVLEQRRQQEARALEQLEAAAAGDKSAACEDDASEREVALTHLQETIDRLYADLKSLRGRNNALAAATGACCFCFGEDALCGECGGRGAPGSRAPEPRHFRKYVLPALRCARAIENARGGRIPSHERNPLAGRSPPEIAD